MNARVRRQLLREWRGYEDDRSREDAFRLVSAALPDVLRSLGLEDRLTEEQIQKAWREIVGVFAAQHALPVRLTRKVLTVQVLQPSVRYTLETMRGTILRRLQERFGADRIQSLRFSIG